MVDIAAPWRPLEISLVLCTISVTVELLVLLIVVLFGVLV
jgi:hypothetical protein